MANDKSTAMEVLVAEMLGDIGKLHEVVIQLKKDLPMLLDNADRSIKKTLLSLPAAADREMSRAGKTAIGVLAQDVAAIANKIAGDVAATERNKSLGWAGLAVIFCAILFGGTGFLIKTYQDKIELEDLAKQVELANSNAQSEIDAARKSAAWAGSDQGRLAMDFFVNGSGLGVAKCEGKTWDKKEFKDGTWCVPQSRPIFGGEGADVYGWKIPSPKK